MYRILCNGLKNYVNDFLPEDERLKVIQPLLLLENLERYEKHRDENTHDYQKLSQVLYIMSTDDALMLEFSSLLWTLESRGILPVQYADMCGNDIDELIKVLRSIKRLAYWKDDCSAIFVT